MIDSDALIQITRILVGGGVTALIIYAFFIKDW